MLNNDAEATRLKEIFQLAIIDFTHKIESDSTLSAADIESANIIVGMAVLNAFNLEQVAKRGADFYCKNMAKVDRLFRAAGEFAGSLQAEGFGLATCET